MKLIIDCKDRKIMLLIKKHLKEMYPETDVRTIVAAEAYAVNEECDKPKHILLPVASKMVSINTDEIMFIKADGVYTELVFKDRKEVVRRRFKDVLSNLRNNFFRVHHSYAVNCLYVDRIEVTDKYYVRMQNGLMIPISKRKQHLVNDLLWKLGYKLSKS